MQRRAVSWTVSLQEAELCIWQWPLCTWKAWNLEMLPFPGNSGNCLWEFPSLKTWESKPPTLLLGSIPYLWCPWVLQSLTMSRPVVCCSKSKVTRSDFFHMCGYLDLCSAVLGLTDHSNPSFYLSAFQGKLFWFPHIPCEMPQVFVSIQHCRTGGVNKMWEQEQIL